MLEVSNRFLGFAGRCKNRAFVIAKDFQPVLKVRGMVEPWFKVQLQMCTEHGACNFGDEFFHGVLCVAKAPGQISVQAAFRAGPVGSFVGNNTVKRGA